MRTLARLALVPATVALLLTACGSKDEAKPAADHGAGRHHGGAGVHGGRDHGG